jgi:hypothetical protein
MVPEPVRVRGDPALSAAADDHLVDPMRSHRPLIVHPQPQFYGPIRLVQTSWTSQGAILPYLLHGLLAAALLLAVAMVVWSRGSAVRSPTTTAKASAPRG